MIPLITVGKGIVPDAAENEPIPSELDSKHQFDPGTSLSESGDADVGANPLSRPVLWIVLAVIAVIVVAGSVPLL